MILVDTSVLIDYFKGKDSTKKELFDEVMERDIPFGISAYTYQEVLQGARDENEYQALKAYLSTQTIYYLPAELETFEQASRMYFDLRRKGVTVRGLIDVYIALTAVTYNLQLLHSDRDFDAMAEKDKRLRIYSGL